MFEQPRSSSLHLVRQLGAIWDLNTAIVLGQKSLNMRPQGHHPRSDANDASNTVKWTDANPDILMGHNP